MELCGWRQSFEEVPDLLAGCVHVWCVAMRQHITSLTALSKLLSSDEQEQVRRIKLPHRQMQFAVSRACLRTALGRYARSDAASLEFEVGTWGKPALRRPTGCEEIQFSISHSHELVVLAVTRSNPLGIDVEHIRPIPEALEIAQTYFSPAESLNLGKAAPDLRSQAFLRYWTFKEAFGKADGRGLFLPLNCVELSAGDPPHIVSITGAERDTEHWSVFVRSFGPDYIGSLVVHGAAKEIVTIWATC